jgi:hypothetical protein
MVTKEKATWKNTTLGGAITKTAKKAKLTEDVLTIRRALDEVQRWVIYLHGHYGITKKVVVGIEHEENHVQKRLGYYEPAENYTHKESGTKLSTIMLTEEFFQRPMRERVTTVAHEEIHVDCDEHGISDTSNKGRFHNKKGYKARAEYHGLIVGPKNGSHGYNITSLTDVEWEIIKVELKPDESAFELLRKAYVAPEKKPATHQKWICDCSKDTNGIPAKHTWQPIKVNLNSLCNDCETEWYVVA